MCLLPAVITATSRALSLPPSSCPSWSSRRSSSSPAAYGGVASERARERRCPVERRRVGSVRSRTRGRSWPPRSGPTARWSRAPVPRSRALRSCSPAPVPLLPWVALAAASRRTAWRQPHLPSASRSPSRARPGVAVRSSTSLPAGFAAPPARLLTVRPATSACCRRHPPSPVDNHPSRARARYRASFAGSEGTISLATSRDSRDR